MNGMHKCRATIITRNAWQEAARIIHATWFHRHYILYMRWFFLYWKRITNVIESDFVEKYEFVTNSTHNARKNHQHKQINEMEDHVVKFIGKDWVPLLRQSFS